AGIVHQPNDRPERTLRLAEHPHNVSLSPNIRLDRLRLSARFPNLPHHRRGFRRAPHVIHRHRIASCRRQSRRCCSNPPTRTSNHHHAQRSNTVIRPSLFHLFPLTASSPLKNLVILSVAKDPLFVSLTPAAQVQDDF